MCQTHLPPKITARRPVRAPLVIMSRIERSIHNTESIHRRMSPIATVLRQAPAVIDHLIAQARLKAAA